MGLFNSFSIGRLDETKRGTAHLIKPVGQKLDVIFILKRQILLVRICDGMSSRAFDVMAIHVNRHVSSSFAKRTRGKVVAKYSNTMISEGENPSAIIIPFPDQSRDKGMPRIVVLSVREKLDNVTPSGWRRNFRQLPRTILMLHEC